MNVNPVSSAQEGHMFGSFGYRPVEQTAPLPIIGYRRNGAPIYPIAGGDGTQTGNPVLTRLRTERDSQTDLMDGILSQVETEERDLVDAEKSNLKAIKDRIGELDEQIKPLEEYEELRQAGRQAEQRHRPTESASTSDDGRRGMGAQVEGRGHEYKTRGEVIVDILVQHNVSNGAESPSGNLSFREEQQRSARERLEGAKVPYPGAPQEYVRAIANEITSDVPGLLPKPIVGAVDNDLDAVRPFVNSIGARDLGSIPGKVFTRPTVTQHTEVGKQSAEKAELPSRKFTVGGVDFTKETYGGALDVSRQVIDWTSPAAWDALLADLQDEYAIETENAAVDAFATAITQETAAPVATDDLRGWAGALYEAASLSYGGVRRLPNHMWVSLDMWAAMGPIVDTARLAFRPGSSDSLGTSSPTNFGGNVLDIERTVVPALPDGTVIIGVKEKTEFYEQRIGLLSAVEPRLLGVEIAYGGYIAYGTIRPSAFAKVQPFEPAP
jgi:hypothetical protein